MQRLLIIAHVNLIKTTNNFKSKTEKSTTEILKN